MTTFLKAIFSALFGWVGSFLTNWLQRREDRSQGAQAQADKETAKAMMTEAAIAQAETNTGRSKEDIIDAASTGNF